MSQPPIFYKNPAVAAILSFFFAGLGQLYNGEIGKGIGFIVGSIVSVGLIPVGIGFITTPILWIAAMVDAYNEAKTINEQLAKQARAGSPDARTKKCPQCAEYVKAEALICRFCRYEFPLVAELEPHAHQAPEAGAWGGWRCNNHPRRTMCCASLFGSGSLASPKVRSTTFSMVRLLWSLPGYRKMHCCAPVKGVKSIKSGRPVRLWRRGGTRYELLTSVLVPLA